MFKYGKIINNLNKENSSGVSYNATVISSGTEITCDLFKGIGKVIIDGKIMGNVEIDGDIVIEVNGYIEGDVKAKHVVCSGDVTGHINSSELVHLCETANVYGDISSTSIKIDEGAVFCGNCKTEATFYQEKIDVSKSEINSDVIPD